MKRRTTAFNLLVAVLFWGALNLAIVAPWPATVPSASAKVTKTVMVELV